MPFDEFHPEATRAAALSLIKPKVMKTYQRKFDLVDASDLSRMAREYDKLFVSVSTRFVDVEIKEQFTTNRRAVSEIPSHISGIDSLIDREFQRLYDGKILEALHRLKAETITLSLKRIRDAQLAKTWA